MVLSDKITGSIARTLQSSGPWLTSGLCCPTGSSLTMAASESLRNFRRLISIHTTDLPLSVLSRAVPERFPNLLCMSFSSCRLQYPVDQEGAFDYFFPSRMAFASFAMARHPNIPRYPVQRGGLTRLQSSLHVTARKICSPCTGQDFYARAFTPFVAIGSVEYNYTGP